MSKLGFVALAALVAAAPAAAVTVTYGAGPDYAGPTVTETFDAVPALPLVQDFTKSYGGVTVDYINVNVNDYGYGNGTNYAGAYNGVGFDSPGNFDIAVHSLQNYFGLLITSSDPTNTITFFYGPVEMFSYTVGNNFSGSSFVNFAFGSQLFDNITFSAGPGTGFETDNFTFAAVPEPASWALMIAGFGLVGVAARRRQRTVAA